MNNETLSTHRERVVKSIDGAVMLPVVLICFFGAIALFIYSIVAGVKDQGNPIWPLFVAAILIWITSGIMMRGFFTLQPNEARVLLLFGAYKGTVRNDGFHWANPFYSRGPGRLRTLAQTLEQHNRLTS